MLRGLILIVWVTALLCTPMLAQRVLPLPAAGPRPNIVPSPAAKIKSEAGPLFPESTHVAPPKPDPILAGHDLNVGKFYYNRGDYVGALVRFDDAIYNDPSLAEAYCRAGDTLWKMRRQPPARSEWTRCLTIAHSGPWADHARKQLTKNKPAQRQLGAGGPQAGASSRPAQLQRRLISGKRGVAAQGPAPIK